MRRNAANQNFNSENFYQSKQQASRAWQKVKHEEEFYDHLSPEMKEAYRDYLNRVKEAAEKSSESQDTTKNHNSDLVAAFLFILVVLILFEIVGQSSDMYNLEKKKDQEKNSGNDK